MRTQRKPPPEWFQNYGYDFESPVIYQDNIFTIILVVEGGGMARTKVMRAKYALTMENV